MTPQILHITNGDSLTENLLSLNLPGKISIWREMLCEGDTLAEVGTSKFIQSRKEFLERWYHIPPNDYEEKFVSQLEKLDQAKNADEIVLWFEFDLFCHINMLAALEFIWQTGLDKPVYLVCSQRLPGDDKLLGLSQLSVKQLKKHYDCKIKLTLEDRSLAHLIWQLYCGDNPKKLKSEIKKTSNFEYLSSCLRAHIERFPNVKSGLNTMETNVLKLVENNKITSYNQLMGYSLLYQGYYGYGDLQVRCLLDKLKPFFRIENEQYELTTFGKQALNKETNFYRDLKDGLVYGGTKKYSYLYDDESHKLLKL